MASIAKLKGWGGWRSSGAWFETRGGAALLTMRVSDLIQRCESAVSKDAGPTLIAAVIAEAWIASLRSQ